MSLVRIRREVREVDLAAAREDRPLESAGSLGVGRVLHPEPLVAVYICIIVIVCDIIYRDFVKEVML